MGILGWGRTSGFGAAGMGILGGRIFLCMNTNIIRRTRSTKVLFVKKKKIDKNANIRNNLWILGADMEIL